MEYIIIFDGLILKQLKQAAKNRQIQDILTKMLNKVEIGGPYAGDLLDSKLFLYEVKNKHPPIRLYYKHIRETNEIYVFEYEMKTSEKKQKKTIHKLQKKMLES